MSTADENYEDEYSEYDEFEDEDDEGGLSGFHVLLIGLAMFGAFATTTYVFYQKGIKQGERRAAAELPFVAADPEPIKIATNDDGETVVEREVYDAYDGDETEAVPVVASGPEEPVDRSTEDPIGSLAADVSDEIGERVASLEEEDADIFETPPADPPQRATEPTPASVAPVETRPTVTTSGSALSGTHVVQVGAFRSNDEAMAQWARMQNRLGTEVIDGKTFHVEEADLGERGVYHRLRVGPFSSSSAAQTYCATLKENGQDCLIKGV